MERASASESLDVLVRGGDSLSIRVVTEMAHPLPDFVRDRLARGIPATLTYQYEIWRDRSGWFDSHQFTLTRGFRLDRDPWTEAFEMAGAGYFEAADSLSTIEARLSKLETQLPIRPEWCDGRTGFRVVSTVILEPLTAGDIGEVEDWLVGEFGGKSGGILGVPGGVLSIVRDLTGLGDRKSSAESFRFLLERTAEDRVVVRFRQR